MNNEAREFFINFLKNEDLYYLYTCVYLQYDIPNKLSLSLNDFCNYFHKYKDLIRRHRDGTVRCVDLNMLVINLKGFYSIVEIDTFDMTTNQYIKIYA